MTNKVSSFLETQYGWPYGANGWNTGMDENLLKFSFMFDGNVDSIVASLPPVSNGAAHFNSADNRFYFGIGSVWYSSPCPKFFIFKIKSNGDFYQFNGVSAVKIDNPSETDSRLDAVELTLSSLGTAAFQNVEDFATQAELDIVEGQAQSYTDVLRNDLADNLDPAKGAGLVGYFSELASTSPSTVLGKLRERVSVLDFIPAADHTAARAGTYDCTTAIQQAIASMPATGGEIYFPHGRYLFSATININKSIIFKGTGSATVNNGNTGSVLLKAASLDGDGVRLAALGAKLVDITVQGVAGNGGDGVVLIESRCVLEDVGVFGMGRDGVRIGIDASPSNSNLWVIRNLKAKANGRDGLHLSSKLRPTLPDANGGLLSLGDLQGNGRCGLYLGNNALNTFVGLVCQANGTYGVYSSPDSYDNTFYGGDFEVNGRVGGASVTSYADFYIESGSIGNRVLGITCFNFPVSFVCNEPDNFILSANDGVFAGDNKYAGLQLRNKASSVPTVLDWYEEGVFTPVVEGITTAGVGTYSIQQGYYTRIGNVVRFHLNVAWSAHTGTGNMRVAGLPFTASNTGFQPVDIVPSAFTTPADSVVRALVAANTNAISLYSVLTSGTTTFAPLAMDTSASCWISGSYTVPG